MNKGQICGWNLAEWLERLAVNVKVPGSIPASSDTVEYEGRQMKRVEWRA